jgi:hypothetical protein
MKLGQNLVHFQPTPRPSRIHHINFRSSELSSACMLSLRFLPLLLIIRSSSQLPPVLRLRLKGMRMEVACLFTVRLSPRDGSGSSLSLNLIIE